MSGPDDPFSFDAEFGDPDYVKSVSDPNRPPQTGKEWVDCRASDIPVTEGGERSPFADLDDEFGTPDAPSSQERTGERAGTDDRNPADDFSDEFETAAAPAGDLPPPPGAPMVEHALYYARRGWPVFPCKPTNKAPFFAGGFHVGNNRRGDDPQMVGLLAKGDDRRANGTAIRRLGRRPRSAEEAGGA